MNIVNGWQGQQVPIKVAKKKAHSIRGNDRTRMSITNWLLLTAREREEEDAIGRKE